MSWDFCFDLLFVLFFFFLVANAFVIWNLGPHWSPIVLHILNEFNFFLASSVFIVLNIQLDTSNHKQIVMSTKSFNTPTLTIANLV